MKYRKKLFTYFLFVFIGFTLIVMFLQFYRERNYKLDSLKSNLDTYANLIYRSTDGNMLNPTASVLTILPANLRVTVINEAGKVYLDNTMNVMQTNELENHIDRPEVILASQYGSGSAVRYSITNKIDYYYYAKYFPGQFIRVALPYDWDLQENLKADKYFIYFIIILFLSSLLILVCIYDKLGRAMSGLNEFLISIEKKDSKYDEIKFPNSEFGEVGQRIVETYALLEQRNKELDNERENILLHFQYMDEGISIYSSDKKNIYANTHFIQTINTILDTPTADANMIFFAEEFSAMVEFLNANISVENKSKDLPIWQGKINKSGNYFAVKLVIYQDSSFEVTVNNITPREKNRLLKQEMTNNIAHELRTPVCSISGYLEILINQTDIETDRHKYYLNRMDIQVKRLSNLIRDIGLITKTEEATDLFYNEDVCISNTIEDVVLDLNPQIESNNIEIRIMVDDEVTLCGNHTLLYAIFRNLIENAINYGGVGINIVIDNYAIDDDFYYFRFSDSGKGVPEEHLNRLFDRFYIVNQGRSRKSGGSGLGLSIVKNAIKYHGGEVIAKTGVGGGLEFVFSLRKNKSSI